MLTPCALTIEEFSIKAQDIVSKLEQYSLQDAYVFCEARLQANLVPWREFSLEKLDFNSTLRLVIFDETMEIRLEVDEISQFHGRIIQEKTQEGGYFRGHDTFLLRKSKSICGDICSKGHVLSREYFEKDSDGMLVFATDRLALAKVGG